jgi:hypothetical protein
MAELKPFFLTGANAKIILNNKTVAFATDVAVSIDIKHATPRVLGRFEVEVVQPLAYEVSGSLTIIRYAKGLKDFNGTTPPGVNQAGNGTGAFGSGQGALASALGLPSGGNFDGGTADNFDPSRYYQSKMFEIEIRQKLSDGSDVPMFRIRDCRFVGSDLKLSKRGLPLQTLQFKARYADDDTVVAKKSGVGQELS